MAGVERRKLAVLATEDVQRVELTEPVKAKEFNRNMLALFAAAGAQHRAAA
jgi:hypothetical protein